MKLRVFVVVLLLAVAAVAGVVRSHTNRGGTLSELPETLHGDSKSTDGAREDIRKSYDLAPGGRVTVAGINGTVKIETADITTAEVYIERVGKNAETLQMRKISIESTPTSLEIRGQKGKAGFLSSLFKSNPTEKVTLKLPRQVSLVTEGVNGAVSIGELDGPVEVRGVNGKVEVAQARGSAGFHGINGNISVAMVEIQRGVTLNGINGNVDLRLAPGLSVQLEAHGMNGNVVSNLPDFVLDEAKHGNYSAHVGSGGNEISANGINGNIILSRSAGKVTTNEQAQN